MYTEMCRRLRGLAEGCSRLSEQGYDLLLNAADAIEALSKDRVCRIEEHGGVTELSVVPRWISVTFEDGGLTASIPDEYDGCWIIVTDGRLISVERFKKDAYDHFYPNGRWFDLENVTHWMPIPEPPGEEKT